MGYGRTILERVDALVKKAKGRFTFTIDESVVEEFQRKCGKRSASSVVEEMMKHFNETTPEPPKKK